MRGCHTPVISSTGSFFGLSEDGAQHYSVSAAGDGFADITAVAHAAVRDNGNIPSRRLMVILPGCSTIDYRCSLGYSHAEDFPGSASRARSHANKHATDTGLHELDTCVVTHTVAYDYRYRHLLHQFREYETP